MPVSRQSNLALAFILITILIDMIGVGIIVPVMPELIQQVTGDSVAGAAKWGGYLVFAYAALQFVFSPILGNLSDRFGRRPVLLLSLFGLTLDYLLMGFANTLLLLFIGRALAGISGAAVATASAYIADITEPDKRAARFGLIGAAFGLGFIIGPVIGGELGEISPRAPFFAAAGLAFVNLLFGYFILPESLTMRKRRRFDIKRANPFGAIIAMAKYPATLWLLGALFLFSFASQAYPAIWSFFTIERFDWTTSQIGRSLAVFGVLFALSQGFLVGPIVKRYGETTATVIGMTAATLAFFGAAFVASETGLYAYLLVAAFSGMAGPAINGLLSKQVPDNAQGELQGAITATNSLTAAFGPLAATQLFSFYTTSPNSPVYFPGVSFFASAILVIISSVIFVYAARRFHLRSPKGETPNRRMDVGLPGEAVTPPSPDSLKRRDPDS